MNMRLEAEVTDTTGEIVQRLKLANRPNASRKLLARKAAERQAGRPDEANALEDAFPSSVPPLVPPQPTLAQPTAPVAPPNSPAAAQASTWSDDDERAFQGLSARRKAVGYQRRGRDFGTQVLAVGKITPNVDTVSAVIVSLVTERGSLTRAALLDAMARAAFLHPKAKPQDRNWCQGYVAGALRDGFLMAAESAVMEPGVEVVAAGGPQ